MNVLCLFSVSSIKKNSRKLRRIKHIIVVKSVIFMQFLIRQRKNFKEILPKDIPFMTNNHLIWSNRDFFVRTCFCNSGCLKKENHNFRLWIYQFARTKQDMSVRIYMTETNEQDSLKSFEKITWFEAIEVSSWVLVSVTAVV